MRSLFLFSFFAAFAACGGGGGSRPALSVASLQGVWVGQSVLLDAPPIGSAGATRVELSIDGAGNITSVRLNGQPSGSGTVTPVPSSTGIFSYALTNGGSGGFYLGGSNNYAAALDEDGTITVLQRSGPALPAYASGDVVGSWTGQSVFVTSGFDYDGRVSSQVQVQGGGTFSGSEDGQAFVSTQPLDFYSGYGGDNGLAFWFARFASAATPDGIGRVVMSPDRRFLAGFAGPNNASFPADFSFPVWFKQ